MWARRYRRYAIVRSADQTEGGSRLASPDPSAPTY